MTAKGHVTLASLVVISIVSTLPYFENLDLFQIGIFYFSSLFGALFPDIDEDRSYIGRRLAFMSIIISSGIQHRTFTHYLIFPIIIYFLAISFINDFVIHLVLLGFVAGIVLHDIGDMFTVGGIKGFFYPFFPNTKIWVTPKFLRFYTGSIAEYIFISFLMFLHILVVWFSLYA